MTTSTALSRPPSESPATPQEQAHITWSTPIKLPALDDVSLPVFDTNLIPAALRENVVDEAERLGVPPEQVLVGTLIAAGALVGNTTRVHPHANSETWAEAGNLFGLVVGSPGTKKSPSVKAALKHPIDIQGALEDEYATGSSERSATEQAFEERITVQRKEIAKAEAKGHTKDVEDRTKKLQELLADQATARRSAPYRLAGDTTMEALAELVSQNPRGVLVFRDEYLGLLETMNRAGRENDRSFYNEGWNSGPYDVHRITRKASKVDPLTLSLLGTIQPAPFKQYIRPLLNSGGGDGFLARHQIVAWTELASLPKPQDRAPNRAAQEQAKAVFEELERHGASQLELRGPGGFEGVHFEEDAQIAMDKWWAELDNLMKTPAVRTRPAYEAHLAKTFAATARISLIYHMIERTAGTATPGITKAQVEAAIATMKFFLEHAKITYDLHVDPNLPLAHRMIEKIESGALTHGMRVRDVQRTVSAKTSAETLAALEQLEKHGWVRVAEETNPGARPSKYVHLNPDYRSSEDPTLN